MTATKTTHSPSVAGKKGFSLISNEKFRQLYAALLQCEMLDQRLRALPQSPSGYEPRTGCKASSAAIATCLRRGDTVIPTPHGLLANYLHSGSLASAEKSRTPQGQLAAANEDALAHKLKKRGSITAVFAAAPQPALMREVFTPAAKQSLPILYIFEAGKTSPAELSHGIPVIRVEASDTVAAYRVAYESISRAREGGGPTIIECAPWPGDPESSNPLLKLENYLAARKLFRPHWKRTLETKFSAAFEKTMASLQP
jgi:hypothetical protein